MNLEAEGNIVTIELAEEMDNSSFRLKKSSIHPADTSANTSSFPTSMSEKSRTATTGLTSNNDSTTSQNTPELKMSFDFMQGKSESSTAQHPVMTTYPYGSTAMRLQNLPLFQPHLDVLPYSSLSYSAISAAPAIYRPSPTEPNALWTSPLMVPMATSEVTSSWNLSSSFPSVVVTGAKSDNRLVALPLDLSAKKKTLPELKNVDRTNSEPNQRSSEVKDAIGEGENSFYLKWNNSPLHFTMDRKKSDCKSDSDHGETRVRLDSNGSVKDGSVPVRPIPKYGLPPYLLSCQDYSSVIGQLGAHFPHAAAPPVLGGTGMMPGMLSNPLPPNPYRSYWETSYGTSIGNQPMASSLSSVPSVSMMGLRIKESVVYEHKVLLGEFADSSAAHRPGGATASPNIQRLKQLYRKQVDHIELLRHMSMQSEQHQDHVQMTLDWERLTLTRQFMAQLCYEKERLAVQMHGSPNPSSVNGDFFVMQSQAFPLNHSTDVTTDMRNKERKASSTMLTDSDNGSMSLSPETGSPLKVQPKTPSQDHFRSSGKRKFLSEYAVGLLNAWYEKHYDHPYPDDSDVDELSVRAGITTLQCKKWMANKRVRSYNTLAFNGSLHPKKLQKMMQVETVASSSSQNGSAGKPRSFLDAAAVEYMNAWYNEHVESPYPTNEEKQEIARATSLTVSQVTCWFANKRNRCNNTRKISASGMIQKLNRKLEMYENMHSKDKV